MMKILRRLLGILVLVFVFLINPFLDALKINIILVVIYICFRSAAFLLRKLLWKIKNKLILSYLFIAFVPLALVAILLFLLSSVFITQYGNYIVGRNIYSRFHFIKRVAKAGQLERWGLTTFDAPNLKKNFLQDLDKREKVKEPEFGLLTNDKKLYYYYYDQEDQRLFGDEIDAATLTNIRDASLWIPEFRIYFSSPLTITLPKEQLPHPTGLKSLLYFKGFSRMDILDLESGRRLPGVMSIVFDFGRISHKFNEYSLTDSLEEGGSRMMYIIALSFTIFFLVLYLFSLVLGFLLARSITSSIYNLYTGTLKLKEKNFNYRITKIRSDQLGEVALSFNAMAGSIERLLEQEKEKQRLSRELELATKMQKKLLPRGDFDNNRIAISGFSVTAQEVGGDFFDFFPLSPDEIFFTIADVSGKGMPAAFYMAEIKGVIRSSICLGKDLTQTVPYINGLLYHSLEKISFVTAVIGIVDLKKPSLRFIRCGHPEPLLIEKNGKSRLLGSEGIALGLQENMVGLFQETEVPLSPGDLFLLYTDGLSEMRNEEGELFGKERILSLFQDASGKEAATIKKMAKDRIMAFLGNEEIPDDITLLMITVKENAK